MADPERLPDPADSLPPELPSEDIPAADSLTEELVAFLDGELPADEAEQVEEKLSLNPQVRREADTLRKAWDLLDLLPRPEPRSDFASRTVERLAPLQSFAEGSGPTRPSGSLSGSASNLSTGTIELAGRAGLVLRFFLVLGYVSAVLLCGLGGWQLRQAIYPHHVPPNDSEIDSRILADMPLLENLYLYRHIDNMEFLETLDRPTYFGEEGN
jgi:hypothetical protein